MSQPLERIKRYEQMGMGLFIHWGLYSLLNQGEWTEYIHNIPKSVYEQLIQKFSASEFKPKKLIKQAKKMGAKYIVLTTKHHEGFFLYDTLGLSHFDASHSAARRDLIREFVDACRAESIIPFFYVATYDWHSPLYQTNFDAYLDYLQKSVEILCTQYGKIGGFWFDGNWNKKNADWHLSELYGMIRKHQPDCIIINNTGLKNRGVVSNPEIDVVTYERGTPDQVNHGVSSEKYVAGEVSVTLNQHWGNAVNDLNYKSPKTILENICHARQIGANVLVNIGLSGNGSIPPMSRNYMTIIGQWFSRFGEAIYDTKPATMASRTNNKDFALKSPTDSYLFFHDLEIVGNSNVVLGGEGVNPRTFINCFDPVDSIEWLDNHEPLTFIQDLKKGLLTIDVTGYPYGCDFTVRVAKLHWRHL